MSNLTRRAILRGTPAAIAAAAITSLPALVGAADADQAADLWRAYRANQVKLYEIIRQEWAILDGGTDPMNLPPLSEHDQRIDYDDGALVRAIENLQSSAPTAIAAKLNVAFDHAGSLDFVADLPWCMLAGALRSVLPHLPADMAAALAPLTKGQSTNLRIKEALRAGGTPVLRDDVDTSAAGAA